MVLANAIQMTKDNLPATDVQYQHVIDGLKYCFEEANNRYDQFKEVHSKRNASLMEDNCNPIGAFSIVCGKRYLLRVSNRLRLFEKVTKYCGLFIVDVSRHGVERWSRVYRAQRVLQCLSVAEILRESKKITIFLSMS
jgi:hypothetical protein